MAQNDRAGVKPLNARRIDRRDDRQGTDFSEDIHGQYEALVAELEENPASFYIFVRIEPNIIEEQLYAIYLKKTT